MRHIVLESLRKQDAIQCFIKAHEAKFGRRPTVEKIAEGTGLSFEVTRYHIRMMRENETRQTMQARVYLFYYRYWQDNGFCPTYKEASDALGISQPGVIKHVQNLKKRGFVKFTHASVRDVQVPAYEEWLKRRATRANV
jgi:DNA-binding Lrp family transcriptional regulator